MHIKFEKDLSNYEAPADIQDDVKTNLEEKNVDIHTIISRPRWGAAEQTFVDMVMNPRDE